MLGAAGAQPNSTAGTDVNEGLGDVYVKAAAVNSLNIVSPPVSVPSSHTHAEVGVLLKQATISIDGLEPSWSNLLVKIDWFTKLVAGIAEVCFVFHKTG